MNIKYLLATTSIALIIGFIVIATAPKIYQSQARVAITRLALEHPEKVNEESRNRWVWVRDGLSMQSLIVDDQLVESFRETIKLTDGPEGREEFLRMIRIDFTGADEFNLKFTVKGQSASVARDIAQALVERVQYLAIERFEETYQQVREALVNELHSSIDKGKTSYFEDRIRELDFFHRLEQTQRSGGVIVVQAPLLDEREIWPNKKAILALSLGIGLVSGIGLGLLRKL
jgi:hypothetical protein